MFDADAGGSVSLMASLRERARLVSRRVVLPEGADPRVREAALRLAREGWARPVLLGDPDAIDLPSGSGVEAIDPSVDCDRFVEPYARRREGVTERMALRLVKRPLFYGAMMVAEGEVDAMVAGATRPTAQVISAAALAVGYAEGVASASSFFLMEWAQAPERRLVFADAAVAVEPSPEGLAAIAALTACNAGVLLEIEPRVAFVGESSRGDGERTASSKATAAAVAAARALAPGIAIDGPLSVRVALAEGGAVSVLPDSPLDRPANVLVFPHLDAANPAYKLVQYLADAQAIGPVMQGFARPVCDLSRGASVEDIVDGAVLAALQG